MRDPFDVSDDAWEEEIEVEKVFTDREEPQEAFERKVRVLQENWQKRPQSKGSKEPFYVLNFYGIGGIGKTSFQNKLCRMIDGVENSPCRILSKIDCDYVSYDFGSERAAKDKLSILLSLRKQLKDKNKKFQFYRFDSAVILYAKKTGIDFTKDKTASSLLEDNKWLNFVVTVIGIHPLVGWVPNALQALDMLGGGVRNAFKEHQNKDAYKDHLEKLHGLQPSQILEELHKYFSEDMRTNMREVVKRPIIVFLDTYEKYIETGNTDNIAIVEDYWLRNGRKSVIQSIPGILWVIMGRERLDWAEEDLVWKELPEEKPLEEMTEEEKEAVAKKRLEQHLLGDLSEKDASSFLQQAGIEDALLRKQLYELTNGTPLFLDICVDTYADLCYQGKTPEIADFGNDLRQLINRYLANLRSYNREMAYFLAIVGSWTDERIKSIKENMHTLREFTFARYQEFIRHSFIIAKADGSYYMHETVRKAALKNADKEIVDEVHAVMAELARREILQGNSLASVAVIQDYITLLSENRYEYAELEYHLAAAVSSFEVLRQMGDYEQLHSVTYKLYAAVAAQYHGTALELIAFTEYVEALLLRGKYTEAGNAYERINYDIRELEMNNGDLIRFRLILLKACRTVGEYVLFTIVSLAENAYEEAKALLGEEHPDTTEALVLLADAYHTNGRREEAIACLDLAMEQLEKGKGILHTETLEVMHRMVLWLYEKDGNREAKETQEQVYQVQLQNYGKLHPLTLQMMSSKGDICLKEDRAQDGLVLYEEVFLLQRKLLGEDHPEVWVTQRKIATAYIALGREREAGNILNEIYWKQKEVLSIRHHDTIATMSCLRQLYEHRECTDSLLKREMAGFHEQLEQAKLDAACNIEEDFYRMQEIVAYYLVKDINFDTYHRDIFETAKANYEEVKAKQGENAPDTLHALVWLALEYQNLGDVYDSPKDYVEAWKLLQKAYVAQKEVLGVNAEETRQTERIIEKLVAVLQEKGISVNRDGGDEDDNVIPFPKPKTE